MGIHDAQMQEKSNLPSTILNTGIDYILGLGGYSGARRGGAQGGAEDNPFYRDNADWMPGWGNTFGLPGLDPNGVPSGATAQDRATNYVGHKANDPDGIWDGVRNNLMTNERAAHAASTEPDGHMGYWDLYNAHVDAYADAQTAGNPARVARGEEAAGNTFIDPASFALAVYGAPLLEHMGIDTGPLTGASIDLFNDPTDTVGDGWAKRMGLAAGEIGAGGVAMGAGGLGIGAGIGNILTGSPLTGLGEIGAGAGSMLAGAGLMGVGAFSGAYNTVTAIGNGMGIGDAASGLVNVGGSVLGAGAQMASDAWGGITSLF
ncbi:MAG: hypothetical protein K8W52_27955 [Deltaproteobacteria bacterium]|nr:hypothetical protein [Deltaproteobacteria bacterium]